MVDIGSGVQREIADIMLTLFAGQRGISLAMPTTHRAMIARMRRADLILSDSGGF